VKAVWENLGGYTRLYLLFTSQDTVPISMLRGGGMYSNVFRVTWPL